MSITQAQFDALKPGDRIEVRGDFDSEDCFILAIHDGTTWAVVENRRNRAFPLTADDIEEVLPPKPVPMSKRYLSKAGDIISTRINDTSWDRYHYSLIQMSDGSWTLTSPPARGDAPDIEVLVSSVRPDPRNPLR